MPATVKHAFSNPAANGTISSVVRPRDWNSAHLMTLAPSGAEMLGGFSNENGVSFNTNTAGRLVASVALATSLAFSNANGITFGVNNGTLSASVDTNYIPLGNSTQFAGEPHTHGSVAGTNISATSANNGLSLSVAPQTALVFSNANGLTFGTNGSTVTGSHNGLTTAAQSNHSHGVTLNLTNINGTTGGNSNGIGLSLSAPAQTVQPVAFSAGNGSANFSTIKFADSQGVSFSTGTQGVYATVKTDYAVSNVTTNNVATANSSLFQHTSATSAITANAFPSANTTKFAGTGFSGTNISGTVNSNGIALSVAAGGGGADGYNILAAGTQTAGTASTINFANSNGITFGMSGSSQITASHNGLTTARASNDAVGLNTALTGNGVAWTVNSSGLSLNVPAFLTTAMQSGASANFAATGFTTTTGAGAVVAGTHDTAGLKLAVPAYLTTAQPVGAYLTTARASNDALGLNTALTANGVSMTANSSGLSLNIPAFITTAMQSQMTSNYMSTAERGNYFYTSNNTFANSTHSHGNPTLALTNLNGTTASASNGLTLSLSAAAQSNQTANLYAGGNTTQLSSTAGMDLRSISFAGAGIASVGVSGGTVLVSVPAGGGGGDGYNILAAGTQTAGLSNTINFANSNGITFGMSGSSQITASHNGLTTAAASDHSHAVSLNLTNLSGTAAGNSNGITLSLSGNSPGGGAAATLSYFEPYPAVGTSYLSLGQNSLYFFPFYADNNYSFSQVDGVISMAGATSSISHAVSQTYSYGLYSRGTGTNNSRYEMASTSSMAIIASYSSNLSAGYTLSQGTNSTTYSSAGTGSTSAWTGQKILGLPFAGSMSAGGEYAFAIANSTNSVGGTGAFRISNMAMTFQSNASIGKLKPNGISASAANLLQDMVGYVYSSTSGAWPANVGNNSMSIQSNLRSYIQFDGLA